jgi:hypothetical protein
MQDLCPLIRLISSGEEMGSRAGWKDEQRQSGEEARGGGEKERERERERQRGRERDFVH